MHRLGKIPTHGEVLILDVKAFLLLSSLRVIIIVEYNIFTKFLVLPNLLNNFLLCL